MNPGIFGDPGLGRSIGLNQGENTNLSHGCYTFLSSGNWVCPDGVFNVWVTGSGGGGGGGGSDGAGNFGAGGAQGIVVVRKQISVVPGTVYPVVIGAGGVGPIANVTPQPGGSGGTTSFGTLLSLTGGAGGTGGLGPTAFPLLGSGWGAGGIVQNAQANSGSGGAGSYPSANGGNGGSGYLTLEW